MRSSVRACAIPHDVQLAYRVYLPQSFRRARVMVLGSTGPMVGFYAFVVLSVSLTLSKAIREAERSAALQGSGVSSDTKKRWAVPWVRRDLGSGRNSNGEVAVAGGSGHVGAAGNRSRANGGYAKTKSMLKKLTRATVAMMTAVMVVVASGLRQGTIAHVSCNRRISLLPSNAFVQYACAQLSIRFHQNLDRWERRKKTKLYSHPTLSCFILRVYTVHHFANTYVLR